MPISPARRIAFDVLRRVTCDGAYASELLFTALGSHISRADAALCTELTLGVLRWQGLLDFLLAHHLHHNERDAPMRAVERLDVDVLVALRIGLYQLRFLDRIPAHAAIGEAVELVKRGHKRSAAGLINAVLRHATPQAKIGAEELENLVPQALAASARLAILHSHPEWLVKRWIVEFGIHSTVALMEANNRPPVLSCTVFNDERIAAVSESLQGQGGIAITPEASRRGYHGGGCKAGPVDNREAEASDANRPPLIAGAKPGRWLRSALILGRGNPVTLSEFQSGEISFQDEASQMVAHLVGARPGDRVLDVCAAPGGKATLLARAVSPGGIVVAADLHVHRLRSMREQLTRTRTRNVNLVALDATQPLPFADGSSTEDSFAQRAVAGFFGRILVDAPCSGTGTLARNPEIRWRLEPRTLKDLHLMQTRMLRQALAVLAPEGRLVYSTCSLEPEENEQVVNEVLSASGTAPVNFHIVTGRAALEPHLQPGISAASFFEGNKHDGFFRTFPPDAHTDGFFAAVIARQ